jgi:shikimate kinase
MLRAMLETRAPLYREVSSLQVQTGDRAVAEAVAEIAAALAAVDSTP